MIKTIKAVVTNKVTTAVVGAVGATATVAATVSTIKRNRKEIEKIDLVMRTFEEMTAEEKFEIVKEVMVEQAKR